MEKSASTVLVEPKAKRSHGVVCLERLGLKRDIDLVLHLPLRYEDETSVVTIAAAQGRAMTGGVSQIEGKVVAQEVTHARRKQLLIYLADETGELVLRFLNFYQSQLQQMAVGKFLRVRGEVRMQFGQYEMVHPTCRVIVDGEMLPQALTPVYPSTAGLGQAYLRKAIYSALGRTTLKETIPAEISTNLLRHLNLWSLDNAVRFLHQPPPATDVDVLAEREHPAWLKLKFDELLAQQLSLKRHYDQRYRCVSPVLPIQQGKDLVAQLLARLPFSLTVAQNKVWHEISADLDKAYPMQRLLQGDVGSGKTVISALAAVQAIAAGYQAALMVPTELLAEQHFQKLSSWLVPLGINVVWLSGNTRAKEKRLIQAQISEGTAQLVVGTHALIQKGVVFARLGLIVIDEQHRFGVNQRMALRQVNHLDLQAHQLIMSATPIPRTLAMTYYTDLDISVIDELPPGRTPIITRVVNANRRDEVIARVRSAVSEGRQVYWVCPLIEESEVLQLQTAVETHEALVQALPDLTISLIHGRLPAAEKAQMMAQFVSQKLQVLVATTVIEVGVDVPNASLMVIEHAERFGLAQLHQLRGRVGRGAVQSACVLLYQGPLSYQASQRLAIMRDTNDGFVIAQRDLELRGPGEFLGARQSGQALLRFADLEKDGDLLEPAQQVAATMLERFPEAALAHLERWLGERTDYLTA